MAIRYAVATGNWSSTATWNGGTLPTSADDVYSNTFTVTIDVSPTVLSISNAAATGVTIGGSFVISANGITLVANLSPSSLALLSVTIAAGSSCAIVGSINSGANGSGVTLSGAGTLSITAVNVYGGTGNNAGAVINASSGVVNVTVSGVVQGGSNSANGSGIYNNGGGTINITGTVVGGSGAVGYGFINASSGTINHIGTAQASATTAAIGPGSSSQITTLTGPLLSTTTAQGTAAASGVNPCIASRWFPRETALSTFSYTMRGETVSGGIRPERVMYLPDAYASGQPNTANVRSGTVYGPGSVYTGTCAVPGASSVLSGVAVDNTTGTATISAASIRSALGMASANLDTQLAAIPTTAAPSASTIATAVWAVATSALSSAGTIGKLLVDNVNATISSAAADSSGVTTLLSRLSSTRATNLDNLDATVSSRSTYAGADTSGTTTLLSRLTSTRAGYLDNLSAAPPTASAIASAVWGAATRTLTTAIDNSSTIASAVWSAVSRTITGGTVDTLTNAPSVPSAATIASQVRTELTTELGRIDAAVSSRLAPGGTLARVTLTDTTTTLSNAPDVPTEAEIADAVRTELTPELARVANCSTTQEVGDIVEGALSN